MAKGNMTIRMEPLLNKQRLIQIQIKQFCEPQNAAESEDIYGIFQQRSEHFADYRDRTGRRPVRLGRRQSSGGLRPGQPRR